MNVLITGCSRGIGKSILNEFLNNKAIKKVYALSSNVSALIPNKKCIPIEVDFLKQGWEEEVLRVVNNDPLGIVINNAGYLYNGVIGSTPLEQTNKMIQINYLAPLALVNSLLNNIKKGQAHIVNIGSMGGYSGSSKFPGLSVYSSTKSAVACLSECWAEELSEFGVRSNCLALGAVNTEMLNEAFPGYEAPVSAALMGSKIADFAVNYGSVMNGKVIPFSISTP